MNITIKNLNRIIKILSTLTVLWIIGLLFHTEIVTNKVQISQSIIIENQTITHNNQSNVLNNQKIILEYLQTLKFTNSMIK
jgi:hypothetical protein